MHCSAVGKSMLATLDEQHVRSLLRQAGMPQQDRVTRSPTSRSMLRELADVAAQGYSIDDEEDVDGVCCVGASIVRDDTGGCAGAISVTGLKARPSRLAPPPDRRERAREHAEAHLGAARRAGRRRCRREAGARRRAARAARARRARDARPRTGGDRHPAGCSAASAAPTSSSARGQLDPAFVRYPLTLGHEWSGVVEAVGDGVGRIAPGDRCRGRVHRPVRQLRRPAAPARRTSARPTTSSASPARAGRATRSSCRPGSCTCSRPTVSLRRRRAGRADVRRLARAREGAADPGRARARDRRRHDRRCSRRISRRSGRPPRSSCWAGAPSRQQLARSVGATGFTIDDEGVTEAFDLVIEAAGATAAMLRGDHAARRGGRVLLLGLPPTGRCSSCRPTCS